MFAEPSVLFAPFFFFFNEAAEALKSLAHEKSQPVEGSAEPGHI